MMSAVKKLMIVVLLISLLTTSITLDQQADANLNTSKHTLLIYMNGSDLESESKAATSDLKEMLLAQSHPQVNVIIETGGTLKWHTKSIANTQNQRWQILNGKLVKLNIALGKRNMGKPETLTDFIQWSVKNYPAQQYSLIFWNHGSGSVKGFGADELFDGDALSLPEISQALVKVKMAQKPLFEWIGFDACLMATIETAAILSHYARFMTASVELEPGHGWDYQAILKKIASKPALKGDELGREVMKSFQAHAKKEGTDQEITLSTIHLGQIPALINELNRLLNKVMPQVESGHAMLTIAKIRRESEAFGRGSNPEDNADMIDLGNWAEGMKLLAPNESDRLLKGLNKTVIASLTSQIAPRATGLAIYFPYWNKSSFKDSIKMYDKISFSSGYQQFVKRFSNYILADVSEIKLPEVELKPNAEEQIELTIPKEQLSQVAGVYSILGQFLDQKQEKTLILGTNHEVDFNEKTGVIAAQFQESWVTLDGHFVTMDVNEIYEDEVLYNIPAMVNGEDADLLVNFDVKKKTYELIGYWTGIDENGTVDKNIDPLIEGDQIIPILEVLDEVSGETTFMEGEEIIWSDESALEQNELPQGTYSFGFVVEDFAQNQTFTDFYVFDVR